MNPILPVITLLFSYMTLWFFVSVIVKKNDVADIAWGLGFILVAWTSYYLSTPSQLAFYVNVLVTLWGVRLATHIYLRNRGKAEDPRYYAWRLSWGNWFYLRSFFQVFILQGILLLLVSIPVIYVNLIARSPTPLTVLGFIIWVTGFIFESVGDYQLTLFKNNPLNKGKVMQSGLWNYTRHPNYFGEVSQWWGIYFMIFPSPWYTIIGPLTITYLILGLSGVPMLEKRYEGNKEYNAYKKRVNSFFPWFPRT